METPETDYSKELELRFKAVMEVALDGIITIDERGNIESINQSACRLFEYQESEIIGCNISKLMPTPYSAEHDAYIEKYRQTGERKIIGIGREVKGLKKSGAIFPIFLNVNEINVGGRKIFTGIIHDISVLKKAESDIVEMNMLLEEKIEERTEQLAETVNQMLQTNYELKKQIIEREAAEEALHLKETELEAALVREKELSELKSRFITMASHEFRTPLSTILSSVSLIERYTTTEQQAQREKHILKVKNAVDNLSGMLSDILSLSRLEEGRFQIKPVPFEMQKFCHEVIEEMQALIKSNQHITCKMPEHPVEVFTDSKILKNILYNLLSNAIKYSDQDINCTLTEDDSYFTIVVQDRGIGISEEDQKQLFGRFFRASNALNIQGTGLGLNIVKKYVDVLNGEMSFESELGRGSTFRIKLPKKHL